MSMPTFRQLVDPVSYYNLYREFKLDIRYACTWWHTSYQMLINTPVHLAARKGYGSVCTVLLAAGAAVEKKDKDGVTPLQLAAQNGHAAACSALVKAGAAVDAQNEAGFTPLHIAAENGHAAACTALLEGGAAVDAQDGTGAATTPLHCAARRGHVAVCTVLLEAGGARFTPQSELAPLHLAALVGHVPTCTVLLEAGAPIDAQTEGGITALRLASMFGQVAACTMLLEAGAAVDAQDKDGVTVLMEAATTGDIAVCTTLLEAGASVNAQEKRWGLTPLHCAAGEQQWDLRGAVMQQLGQTGDGALNRRVAVCTVLLGAGAAIDAQDEEHHYTPLYFAASHNQTETVRWLLSLGADVSNDTAELFYTADPLHTWADGGQRKQGVVLKEEEIDAMGLGRASSNRALLAGMRSLVIDDVSR